VNRVRTKYNINRYTAFLLRISITIGLLIWVCARIDFQQFWQTIKTARWQLLIAVWLIAIFIIWLSSLKLQLILKEQSCSIAITNVLGINFLQSIYRMAMPGAVSAGIKWYSLKQNTGKGDNVFCSLVYNDLSEIVCRTACALVAVIVANPAEILLTNKENHWLLPVVCSIFLVAIIILFCIFLNPITGSKVIKVIEVLFRIFPRKIHIKIQKLLVQVALFQYAGILFHLRIAVINLVFVLFGTIPTFYLISKAVNVSLPVSVFLWLSGIIYLLGRIPISVANLGVREVTMVGVLALYGVEESSALLMSMLFFSVSIFISFAGVVYVFFWELFSDNRQS